MFRRRPKPLPVNQPSDQSSWHPEQRHLDTVVFVHGILGSHAGSWGDFPKLLASDPDLPRLDILCWGYRSGLAPGSYQDVETEGEALVAELETLIRDGNDIYLVGHSMGGLVLLKGLVNWIRCRTGRNHPVVWVRRIVLYACPLHGSAVANVVAFAMELRWWLRLAARILPSKQLRDLRRGDFCNRLLSDVVELIYRPKSSHPLVDRAIPVRACAAKHDQFVAKHSAVSVFQDPPPKYLEGNHSTIKLPAHHGDARYLVLRNDLDAGLAESFHELCMETLDGDVAVRSAALQRFDERYRAMLERCADKCFRRTLTSADLEEILAVVCQVGSIGPVAPAQVMSQVVRDYRYAGKARSRAL